MYRVHAMCMAEVSSAKSVRVAFASKRSLLLGIVGGSNQPMGAYSRRSELTSGITRNGAVGRTLTCQSVGVSASLRVDLRLLSRRKARTAEILSRTRDSRASTSGGTSCRARIHRSPPCKYSRAPMNGRRKGAASGSASRNALRSGASKIVLPPSIGWEPVRSCCIPLIGALSSRTTRCGSDSPPASNR